MLQPVEAEYTCGNKVVFVVVVVDVVVVEDNW